MGISSARIPYAIGAAAWGSKAAQEGIPVIEHFEPDLVTDSSSSARSAGNANLPPGEDFDIGSIYFACSPQTLFSPAHAILFLDKFFENTSVGSSPNYDRNYEAEDVPGEPSTPYINIWKKTGKVGHDNNLCVYNGLVTGFTLTKEQGRPLILIPHLSFGARSLTESDPDAWMIDRTNGNIDPISDGDVTFLIGVPGGSSTTYKVTDFTLNLSCAIMPHFFGSQNPDRFSRERMAMDGEIALRDITDQVEDFASWLEGSTVKSAAIGLGSYSVIYLNLNIHAGGASEDEITRRGRFNFTGVYESDAIYPTGFRMWLRSGRPYTP